VADYSGSRRAIEPMSPALAASAFAEDDAAATCPECGAGIRPGQEWCSLCMHVLRPPEPEPAPAPAPLPVLMSQSTVATEPASFDVTSEVAPEGSSAEVRAQVDAAADALLAQLAVESSHNRLNVPEFLNSKSRIAVFVAVAMTVLCALGIATLAVLGSLFG
jgi:rubredoxin